MASRTVLARLVIDGVEGVITGFKAAGSAAVEYGRVAQSAGTTATRWVDKHQSGLDKVGGSLLKMGAVGALALGGMAKSAIDWESAWAGVTKTVSGTPDQLAAVEAGLRGMSKVLPASHDEIAAVAEAAGQLGVKTGSVVDFTRTMLDLGETTNLSAEEAASSLAKMMNIMGTSQGDVDRLGSTIVALGNNSATTEADIVAMSQRIAGVGKQMGLTEADVIGMAASLSSVGVEAEAGGTAVSTVMKKIDKDVREGGEGLEQWAQLAGVSSSEFSTAWRSDAAGAVATLTEGIGGMIARGEDANGVLSDLGVTGIRESDSLLRLAGATKAAGGEQDLLRESLTLSADAWEANTALQKEAEQRYQTRASQAKIAINSIKDEAITLGQNLLPVFDSLVSGIGSVVEAISGLPDGVKSVATNVLLVGTAGALAAGGVLKLVVGLSRAKTAITALGIGVRTATVAMGAVGIAIAAAGTILSLWAGKQANAKEQVDSYTAAIREQGGVLGDLTRDRAAQNLLDSGAVDVAKELGVALSDVTEAALGNEDAYRRVTSATADEMDALNDSIAAKALAGEYTGDLAEKQRQLTEQQQELTGAVDGQRSVFASAIEATSDMAELTGESTDATKKSAAASQDDAEKKQEQAEAIQQAVDAQQAMIEETFNLANAMLQISGSEIGMEASIDALTETVAKNTKEYGENAGWLDKSRESGRENQKALDDLAQSTMTYTQTLYDQGYGAEEVAAKTQGARDAWVDARVAMGGNRDESIKLAAALFAVPEQVVTTVATPGAKLSKQEADDLNAALDGLPDDVKSEIITVARRDGYDTAMRLLADANGKTATSTINIVTRLSTIGVSSTPIKGRVLPEAHGGVVDYYASGAIRENHVAQIAPAGAWRVWAEDETGGESYIPLHPSKRRRSLDIWQETGRRLGVRNLASGAVLGGPSLAVGSGSVTNEFTFGPGAFDNAFPGVRTAAEIERVLTNLPQLARMNGAPRG